MKKVVLLGDSIRLWGYGTKVPEMLGEELGGEFFTVHRLDMNVGGVMVYARQKKAAGASAAAVEVI